MPDPESHPPSFSPADLIPKDRVPRIDGIIAALFGASEIDGPQLVHSPIPEWALSLGRRIRKAILAETVVTNESQANGRLLGIFLRISKENSAVSEQFGPAVSKLKEMLPGMLAEALALPNKECAEFFRSFGKVLDGTLDEQLVGIGGSRRFVIYMVLLSLWQEIDRFQRSTDLHAFLAGKVPIGVLGDLEPFQRLCRELGLFRGRRGRPQKNRKSGVSSPT